MTLFGARLRGIREQRGWTQGELELSSGIRRAHISRLETGQRKNPSATLVARLAKALNISTDYLVGLTDDPTPSREAICGPDEYSVMADEAYRLLLRLPEGRRQEILALLRAMVKNMSVLEEEAIGP